MYHPLKVADKPGWQARPPEQQWCKRYRLCLAVRRDFNQAINNKAFKMETLPVALRMVLPGDELSKGDMEAGYNHLVLREEARRLVRFMVDGVPFEMTVLFFGLNIAPRVFATVVGRALAFLRLPCRAGCPHGAQCLKRHGLRISGYLDDWLVEGQRIQEALSQWVWPVTAALGSAGATSATGYPARARFTWDWWWTRGAGECLCRTGVASSWWTRRAIFCERAW